MSTLDRPEPRVLPPLVAGQRLDQAAFHERYEAMPPDTWAELIGGVVHMPSPLRGDHGDMNDDIVGWLFLYRRSAFGLRSAGNTTTILGDQAEVQPDTSLRIPEELGGQTRIVDGYITGAPELVVEIARSSRAIDLGPKKLEYERAGVQEYLVIELEPDRVHWFALRGGRFEPLPAGPDGVYRSEVFPGLWLDPRALFAHDLDGLSATLEQGLATPEHAAFVARLAAARRPGG